MAPSGPNGASGWRPPLVALALLLLGALAALLFWRRPSPVAVVPSALPTDTVDDEEARLMSGAQQALAAGDTDRAFSLLYEQATKFPKGKLTEQRELTHMRALCRAGKPLEAREEADDFLAQRAASPLATAVRAACPPSP